jgi:hypothetical protein
MLNSLSEDEMTNKLINLTLLKVNAEIEGTLPTYPEDIYQKISQDSNFKNKLLAYVLTRIPNRYIATNEENIPEFWSESVFCSLHEQIEIEELIQQGVYYLVNKQETAYKFSRRSRKTDSAYSPSDWFG